MRRGNSVRPNTGPRRSNVAGFPAYPETLRPGQVDGPAASEDTTEAPPAVILNGSALPKAAAVVVEIPSANDDKAPDSSTRSKDGPAGEVAVAKEQSAAPKADAAPAIVEKEEAKAKEPVKPETERPARMRTDRPDRPERRSRERKGGRGRSAAPPPVAPAAEEPKAAEKAAVAKGPFVEEASTDAAGPVDKAPHADLPLDERFFAEGVHSEREMLASATSARPSAPIEEEIDPKILLKLQPDVRARRAKFGSVAKWVSIVCVALIGVAVLVRYKNGLDSQEAADREMAAYAAAHTYTAPAEKPPAPTAPAPTANAPTAAAAAADLEAVPAPPADSAAANPAASNAPPGKSPLGPEAVASAAAGAPGAPAGTVQTDTETPPAKTAQQEKRDAQSFLDRGAFGRAIEAGERSVALDPSDGEAWLLLGAAYQSQGRAGDAKRSFNNCLTKAKRGPIGECRAMLQ